MPSPDDADRQDPRFLGAIRLTPAFGMQVGGLRQSHDVPAFGTREHSALMTGALELDALERTRANGPLIGFAPIVLDPRGPVADDLPGGRRGADDRRFADRRLDDWRHDGRRHDDRPLDDRPLDDRGTARGAAVRGPSGERALPSRRSLRAGSAASSLGRPLAADLLPGTTPTRSGSRRAALPRPTTAPSGALPVTAAAALTTGALRVCDVREALAAVPARPTPDPTPTGELARPFVSESVAADWLGLSDVPPPVSVDEFQRAVRAGLAIDDTARLRALDGAGAPCAGRSRRELRARERAASPRGLTARRIAKGGVLAITALGVVSAATPQTLTTFGLGKDAPGGNSVDFGSALGRQTAAPALTPAQVEQLRFTALAEQLNVERSAAKASAAMEAGQQAGGAMAALAQQQDQQAQGGPTQAQKAQALAQQALAQQALARQALAGRQAAASGAVRSAIDDPRAYASLLVADKGWGVGQFQCLDALWDKESGWNYRATNPVSNAYGIAQALPGSKMNSVGADWRTNPVTQIKWGLQYIESRYGTPCGAWEHSMVDGWY